jgi:hypothetical protein
MLTRHAILTAAVLLVAFCSAQGSPIYSLDFDVVHTTYDPGTGLWKYLGLTRVMDITYGGPVETQAPYTYADFLLETYLANDTSTGTQASGAFNTGTMRISDSTTGVDLLVADLSWMNVEESTYTPLRLISASGELEVTGGTLAPVVPTINLYGLAFVNVPNVDDLDYDALETDSLVNVTFAVPEPATMLLFGGVATAVLVKRRRRKLAV